MSLILKLKDESTIELADASMAKHFTVVCSSRADFIDIWNRLTPENLSEVSITDGVTVLNTIANMRLVGTQTMDMQDGRVTAHFYTDGGEFVVDEYVEAGRILLGEE